MKYVRILVRYLPDVLIIGGATVVSLFIIDVPYSEEGTFIVSMAALLVGIDILVRRHHACTACGSGSTCACACDRCGKHDSMSSCPCAGK